ncbi:site-specific integrase [Candidatus Woesearchaeota archaeon]|nr:site-specific integrase [Candidatus Woesearchaeota archaeon]
MLLEQLQKEGQRRGLSPRTVSTYAYCVQKFLRHFHYKELKCITKEEIKNYLDNFLNCPNTLNVYLNALKFFFEEVLHKKLTLNLQFTKTSRRLPEFLTQEETNSLLKQIENPKHNLIISLIYSAGFRVSEVLNLKVKDLQLEQNYGWVRQGKGRKDRPFIIAQNLKPILQEWIDNLSPENYLFTGIHGQYTASSVRQILKQAKRKAKISKNIHPHTLRHSFATHLIQNGYAVTEVQPLLGHSKLETTMIYVHMAAPQLLTIKSPLDTLSNSPKSL